MFKYCASLYITPDRYSQVALEKRIIKYYKSYFKRFYLPFCKRIMKIYVLRLAKNPPKYLLSSLPTLDPPAIGLKKTQSNNFMVSD